MCWDHPICWDKLRMRWVLVFSVTGRAISWATLGQHQQLRPRAQDRVNDWPHLGPGGLWFPFGRKPQPTYLLNLCLKANAAEYWELSQDEKAKLVSEGLAARDNVRVGRPAFLSKDIVAAWRKQTAVSVALQKYQELEREQAIDKIIS